MPGDISQFQQKDELITKLLACSCFKTPGLRAQIELELPEAIRHQIVRPDLRTDKSETLAIVNACLSVGEGLSWLIRVIGSLDGGTLPFEALQVFVDGLGYGGLLPFSSNLLPARNPKFTGREHELASLHKTLQDTNMVAVTALHGLGGVGKTSLAIEYIYRHQKAYNLIVWLPAENRLTLELEFIGLLGVLGLPDMPIDTEENRARAVGAVKRELARRGKGWLLVFDNAEKPEDVAAFRSGGAAGHVIVTSRNIQMGKLGRAVEVDVLTESDALKLLAVYCYPGGEHEQAGEVAWRGAAEKKAAEQLVAALGYLALAITQAGAYIQATSNSLSEYLELFSKVKLELFKEDFARPSDYPLTVATTWELAFRRVSDIDTNAANLLNLLAFFAPANIQLTWLTENSAGNLLPPALGELMANRLLLNRSLAVLGEYSLLMREGDSLAVHRLVQLVTRERERTLAGKQKQVIEQTATALPQTNWLTLALKLLSKVVDVDVADYRQWTKCEQALPHIQTIIEHAQNMADFSEPILLSMLAHRAGLYLESRNFYAAAEPLVRLALSQGNQVTTSANQLTILNLNLLGIILQALGRYPEAKECLEQALWFTQAILGAEHADIAACLNNMGSLLTEMGQYAEARPIIYRALTLKEKTEIATNGVHSLDFAIGLSNLAKLEHLGGNYQAALNLYKRALSISENIAEPNHTCTADILSSLGGVLSEMGKYTEAQPLLERALAISEKTAGPNHLDVATRLTNLAGLFSQSKKYGEALPLFERARVITEKLLGPEHPDMIERLINLGATLLSLGNYQEARPLLEQALSLAKKLLGANHPKVAIALNTLGSLFYMQGEYRKAAEYLGQALVLTEKTLGPEHPAMAARLTNLAGVFLQIGNRGAGLDYLKRALAILEKTLGTAHPQTQEIAQAVCQLERELATETDSLTNPNTYGKTKRKASPVEQLDLANWLQSLASQCIAKGEYHKAKPLLKIAVTIRETLLGSDNLQLADSLTNLAFVTLATEKNGKLVALPMLKRAYAIFEKNLGSDHPHTSQFFQAISQLEAETEAI